MTKFYTILCLAGMLILTRTESAKAQCSGVDSLIYWFNNPNGSGVFTGFLCAGADSVGTLGTNGYYNGDGYVINLVAGSRIIFSVDSCNGAAVSLTIADSSKITIPGAYAGPACHNSLNFTAPYTGSFIVFINLNGICNVFGNTLLGQVYSKIQSGTPIPDCPVANVINDTICGATPLFINSSFEKGNTSIAFPSDPMDAYVSSLGYVCSPPNNTLWYSFTAPANIDTINIWLTSNPGGGFHSWLGIFTANDPNNACLGGLTYNRCVEGPDDGTGIDTINISLRGLIAGQVYFFMIDGYNGGTGEFSIAIKSQPYLNSIFEINDFHNFYIFPNPAKNSINIKTLTAIDASITLLNSVGQVVFSNQYNNFLFANIDISNLSPGVYMVKITNTKETLRTKIIINK